MSQPHQKLTMFYTEGNSIAVLVTSTGKEGHSGTERTKKNVRHASPGAALEWCREHSASFIYSPNVEPDHSVN